MTSPAIATVGNSAVVIASNDSAEGSPLSDNVTITLSRNQKLVILFVAFSGLLCAGNQLGLNPIFSLSAIQHFFGSSYSHGIGGQWASYFTAATMFGAAIGGIILGSLGDVFGRSKMLGVCILLCTLFGSLGAIAKSPTQLLITRFIVGLGIGGVWPNGVALVSECWTGISRATTSAIMGTAINFGIFIISQLGGRIDVTSQSWRWILGWSGLPAVIGIYALFLLAESPAWLRAQTIHASNADGKRKMVSRSPLVELFSPQLLRTTIVGIALGTIPLVGAWAAGKWIIPWADKVGGQADPGYKATVQAYWSVGAIMGSFLGAYLAVSLGRRKAYFLISLLSLAVTGSIFLWLRPFHPLFLKVVFVQGIVSTLYFGWLPLCLPEMFPMQVRAAGTGIAYNTGRFAAGIGILAGGVLLSWSNGDYAKVGLTLSMVYALGMIVIFFASDTTTRNSFQRANSPAPTPE